MALIDTLRNALGLTILAVSLLPGIVSAGDEDSKPAYMIYIDPDTGRYTTVDPHADEVSDRVVRTEPAPDIDGPKLPARIVGATALAVLVIGAVIILRRKHLRQI